MVRARADAGPSRARTLLPLSDITDRVRAAPARAGATRVIAVDGRAGSGKSTLAGRLARRLDAPVVHMDDLHPGWDGLAAAVPRLVEWVLGPLAGGRGARYRRYDWHRGEYAEWVRVPRADLRVDGDPRLPHDPDREVVTLP